MGMPSRVTPERLAEAKALLDGGEHTRVQVRQITGLRNEVLTQHFGYAPKKGYLSPEQLAEALVLLRDDRMPYTEVASLYGVHKETLSQRLPGYGLSRQELGVLGNAVRVANQHARKAGAYI